MTRFLPLLLALVFLGGLIWLFRVVQRFDPSVARPPEYLQAGLGDVSVRLEQAAILADAEGRPEWRMNADRIDLRRAYGDLTSYRGADFVGIRDGILYQEGRPQLYFSARSASYDQPSQRFEILGSIQLRSARRDRLESERMIWEPRDDYVRFPQGAHGVLRGHRIRAPILFYAPRRRLVECPQGAEGTFEGYLLRASALFWDVERGILRCPGTVSGERRQFSYVAQNAVLNLKTHELRANKGTIRLRIESENEEWEGLR